jgi:heptosyltransferase-1
VRLLIVKTSSMGDVVHALPLAADIARARPQAIIDWLVEESLAALPAMSRHVRTVHRIALRRWRHELLSAKTHAEIRRARRAIRESGYDLVLDAQGLLKSAWVARWAQAPVAGLNSAAVRERLASVLYSQRFDVARELHAVERCRRLGAAALGYEAAGPPRFDLKEPRKCAVELKAPYAVLLSNASRATKLWPSTHWIELERWLAGQGMASVLFWGSTIEYEKVNALAQQMQRAVVAPKSGLDAIAGTLAGARLVIGLDTGLTHLAAALGAATVGLFCDYDPRLVGLTGDGPVASLGGVNQPPEVNEVIATAQRLPEGKE